MAKKKSSHNKLTKQQLKKLKGGVQFCQLTHCAQDAKVVTCSADGKSGAECTAHSAQTIVITDSGGTGTKKTLK